MKVIVIFLVIVFFPFSYLLGQDEVEEEVIANAQLFLQKREGNLKSTKPLLSANENSKSYHLAKFLENKTNKNQLFIHNVGEKQGWIITEKIGDKLFVLGYSLNGSFDYEKSVPYVKNWLSVKLDSVSLKESAKVQQKTTLNTTKDYYRLEPFLKTKEGELIKWNQFPYYNEACPVIDGEKAPVGCAATAMGQLMKYWEFPSMSRGSVNYEYVYLTRDSALFQFERSFGEKSYNWDEMPASLTDSSTSEEIKEISELLVDIGHSVKTAYNLGGSSAIQADFVGLQRNFNYKKPTLIHIYDDIGDAKEGADSSAFHSQIIENLEKRYPVLVVGYVFGGFHAMVCDGYDNEGFYHLSYGWGGQSDGYYHFSENVWCAAHDFLFVDAYINLIPSELNYSSSVVNYNAIVKPNQSDSLTIQIEEDDRSCPFYFKPRLNLKKADGSVISPNITYSLDTSNALITIKYETPEDEGIYDLTVSFNTKSDTIFLDPLGLTVDNNYENISGDIQIASFHSVNNFNYETPTISLSIELQNKSIQTVCNVKSELISDQGAVEYSSVNSINLSGNSTQIEFTIPLHEIPYGNKQLKISVDYNNLVLETNELNNSLFIPVSFNREIPISEWETLKTFYANCSGETWIHKKKWLSNEPIGTWDGVTVADGHVTELSNTLEISKYVSDGWTSGACESNSFKGGKFPDLNNLSKLEVIDFWFAGMNDSIPQTITNLKSLRRLVLCSCNLSGHIPEDIGKLQNIERIMLECNKLSGELPLSIFNLTKLNWLIISNNLNLTGNIDSIGKLQNLVLLRLNNTQIGGKFPADIFNLPNLMEFSANSCLFKGQIPIVDRTNNLLYCFDIGNNIYSGITNQMEGDIFKTLVHCTNMRLLDISNNEFTGTIPSNVVGAKVAREFNLSNNNFDFMEHIVRDTLSPFLTNLNIRNNNLEFQSFENNLDLLGKGFFSYSPQDSVGEAIVIQIAEGEDFNHPFSCDGTNNIYQWFKNGIAIGVPSDNGDLNLSNFKTDDYGKYICEIANPFVNQLKLYSRSVTVLPYTMLDVSNNNILLGNEDGSFSTVDVYSNTDWNVTSDQSWINLNVTEGTLDGQIIISAEANPTVSERTAIVIISATWVSPQAITITQAAGNATLSVSTNNIQLNKDEGSSSTVEVYSNTDWNVTSDQSWINLNVTEGTMNGPIVITAEANPTGLERTALVVVSATGVSPQNIIIIQAGGVATLSVSTNNIQLNKDAGSSSTIEVYSNTDWNITSDQPWINLNITEGTLNGIIVITAEANSTFLERTALVTISATGVSSQTITIIQAASSNVYANHYDLANIELYPNPANAYFSINGIEEDVVLSIFNLDGILMLSKRVLPDEKIQISGFNEGIYFVTIKTQGETVIRKLIKK
jgi:hypothetical protein